MATTQKPCVLPVGFMGRVGVHFLCPGGGDISTCNEWSHQPTLPPHPQSSSFSRITPVVFNQNEQLQPTRTPKVAYGVLLSSPAQGGNWGSQEILRTVKKDPRAPAMTIWSNIEEVSPKLTQQQL